MKIIAEAGSFEDALSSLKKGYRVSRKGWNGKGMWINLQTPDTNSKMSLPYIYMKTVDNQQVPWLASQTDLLANDWQVVEV
jgi:hypothetical protein